MGACLRAKQLMRRWASGSRKRLMLTKGLRHLLRNSEPSMLIEIIIVVCIGLLFGLCVYLVLT